MARFKTGEYTKLEIFAKSKETIQGFVKLKMAGHDEIRAKAGNGYFKWIQIPLEKDAWYELLWDECEVSLAYLSGCDDILNKGVCYLEIGGDIKEITGSEFTRFYDTSYREQYHFVPFKNWVNDPNGLCWYKGYYHLFYQYNPHSQTWGNMYWGHAASKDMIHWVHLPVVLEPQEDLKNDPSQKGGAFSGSAVPLEEEVRFYLTRHYGPEEDGADTIEWQTMTTSSDMISFGQEIDIIREKPTGVNQHFRDPKVVKIGNCWYMVLASNLDGNSTVLLYQSEDMKQWSYVGPLITETEGKSSTFECPDFFELEGKYVTLAALMEHHDENGRYQMTRCYIGDFKEKRFQVESEQWFDFGSNFYAVQSFEHAGRRIAIGWISDFYGEHREIENGACGSFSIPRELSIKDGHLHMEPVPEVYELCKEKLYSGRENVSLEIPGNSYFARILLKESMDFAVLLGQEGEDRISLAREEGKTRIKTSGRKTDHIIFEAGVKEVWQLDIFVDRRTVEVFINKGEAAGTKIFYNNSKEGIFKTMFPDPEKIDGIEVYSMKSIW